MGPAAPKFENLSVIFQLFYLRLEGLEPQRAATNLVPHSAIFINTYSNYGSLVELINAASKAMVALAMVANSVRTHSFRCISCYSKTQHKIAFILAVVMAMTANIVSAYSGAKNI